MFLHQQFYPEYLNYGYTKIEIKDKRTEYGKTSVWWMSPLTMLSVKAGLSFWLFEHCCATAWMNNTFMQVIYYFSYWGVAVSSVACLLEALAGFYPERLTKAATVVTGYALGYNVIITIMFWGMMTDVFKAYSHRGLGAYSWYHSTCTHTLPLTSSIYCLLITRSIEMHPNDYKIMFPITLSYMYWCYAGGVAKGTPMYPNPWLDWSNPAKSIFSYTMLAASTSFVNWGVSKFWNKYIDTK
jgi:hypothetical protein